MYTLGSRLRDLWDAIVHTHDDDDITDQDGAINLDRLSTRQGVILNLRIASRLLTRVAALSENVDQLSYTTETLEVYMSQIQDALAEQGATIGRLAGAMDDELAQLQAQLEEAQAKLDNEEAADLAEALVTVEGIRSNTNQLSAMADRLQENDEVDEPEVEPTPEPAPEPTPEPEPAPETPADPEPTDPETPAEPPQVDPVEDDSDDEGDVPPQAR